jgi:hypothetical protein
MLVTVTRPLRIRLPFGDVTLTPGHLMKLTFGLELLQRLLAEAGECVRPLRIGSLLVWDSPLFGMCTGKVTSLPEGEWVRIRDHSIIRDEAEISLHWIREVRPESDQSEGADMFPANHACILSGR